MYYLALSYEKNQDFVRAHAWFNLYAAAVDLGYEKGKSPTELKRDELEKQLQKAQGIAQICFVKNYKECD